MNVFKEMTMMMSKIFLQRAARPLRAGGGAGEGGLKDIFSAESSPARQGKGIYTSFSNLHLTLIFKENPLPFVIPAKAKNPVS